MLVLVISLCVLKLKIFVLYHTLDIHNFSDIPKRRKTRTWTMTVVCLADKESSRVPSSAEKEILLKAGLGTRKIQFLTSDTEADVLKTIASDRSTES